MSVHSYEFSLEDGRRVRIEYIPVGESGVDAFDKHDMPTYNVFAEGRQLNISPKLCGSGWNDATVERDVRRIFFSGGA